MTPNYESSKITFTVVGQLLRGEEKKAFDQCETYNQELRSFENQDIC